MSIKIEFFVSGKDELDEHMAALGYQPHDAFSVRLDELRAQRAATTAREDTIWDTEHAEQEEMTDEEAQADASMEDVRRNEPTDIVAKTNEPEPARKPGEPSPGRQRRTKEQIAEDVAYFAALKEAQDVEAKKINLSVTAAISTGEERINPADAADEARAAGSSTVLTRDDVRKAVGVYTKKYGIPHAQEHLPRIMGYVGPQAVPDTQEELGAVIEKINWATENPPSAQSAASTPAEAPPVTATAADIMEAFKGYAGRYDGTEDLAKAPFLAADGPRILQSVFGPECLRIGLIPASPENYGKALTAINRAVLENPFGRAVVL